MTAFKKALEQMGEDLSKDHTCKVVIIQTHFYKGEHIKTETSQPFTLKTGDSITVTCDGIRCVQ